MQPVVSSRVGRVLSGGTQSGFPASVLMFVAEGEADPGAWGGEAGGTVLCRAALGTSC